MTVFIAPIGPGLGDLIVSLPAIQWLIASGQPTWLVLRSPRQSGLDKLIPGLAGAIREVDLRQTIDAGAAASSYINLREHPLQTAHIWGSPEFEAAYPHYTIVDIVRDICHDFGIAADFTNLVPMPFTPRPEVAGKIVFIPGSDGVFKCWPTENWLALRDRLDSHGHRSVMIGQPHHSQAVAALVESGLDWLETPTMRDALDVVSSARAIASVDTGLMHLALQQGVPVAATWINNTASLTFLRKDKHCFPIVSQPCQTRCVTQDMEQNMNLVTEWTEWKPYDSWKCSAPSGSGCMENISVETFADTIQKALQHSRRPVSETPKCLATDIYRSINP